MGLLPLPHEFINHSWSMRKPFSPVDIVIRDSSPPLHTHLALEALVSTLHTSVNTSSSHQATAQPQAVAAWHTSQRTLNLSCYEDSIISKFRAGDICQGLWREELLPFMKTRRQ